MLFVKANQSKIWLESHCKFTWLEIPKKIIIAYLVMPE